jgi:hypothetical protein
MPTAANRLPLDATRPESENHFVFILSFAPD